MQLYYAPGACSLSLHIVAVEAGIPLDYVKVNLKEHKTENGDDYYQINPKGSVPALRLDDGSLLTEGPVITVPTITLGIIPLMTERAAVPSAGFWIFGDSLAALETPTASIEVTRPQEIDLYTRMVEHLKASASYGAAARALIIRTLGELS